MEMHFIITKMIYEQGSVQRKSILGEELDIVQYVCHETDLNLGKVLKICQLALFAQQHLDSLSHS